MTLLVAVWCALGVIPAIIFEHWLTRRYGCKPDQCSALRLLIAFIAGPIAFAVIALVIDMTEEGDENE